MFWHRTQLMLSTISFLMTGTACLAEVRVMDLPATATHNSHYVSNRVLRQSARW